MTDRYSTITYIPSLPHLVYTVYDCETKTTPAMLYPTRRGTWILRVIATHEKREFASKQEALDSLATISETPNVGDDYTIASDTGVVIAQVRHTDVGN